MRQGKIFGKKQKIQKLCMLRYQSWWSSNLWHNVLGVRKKTFGQLLLIMTNSRLEPGKIQSILTWKNLNGWKIAISCQKSLGNPLPIRSCTFSSVSEKLQAIVIHIRILFSLLISMLLVNLKNFWLSYHWYPVTVHNKFIHWYTFIR